MRLDAQRPLGLIAMLTSVVLLLVVLATRSGDQADAVVDAAATPTPRPTVTPTPNPFTVETSDGVVTIRRLSSPTPNMVRAEGAVTVAQVTVTVTTDGQPIGTAQIVAQPNGAFEVDIFGLAPGPQEVCIADACQRVLVTDPTTEPPEAIDARIIEAVDIANGHFDIDRYLPEWTIEIAGANSSTGGTAIIEDKVLSINANSGRSLDEYVITILHEVGHAVDADYLSDDERERFRSIRGHDATLPWGVTDGLSIGDDRWLNSAEDFAEVFVAWVLGDGYLIESTSVAPQPTAADLVTFCELLALDEIVCS